MSSIIVQHNLSSLSAQGLTTTNVGNLMTRTKRVSDVGTGVSININGGSIHSHLMENPAVCDDAAPVDVQFRMKPYEPGVEHSYTLPDGSIKTLPADDAPGVIVYDCDSKKIYVGGVPFPSADAVIRDSDIAEEMLSNSDVINVEATSMLAQANAQNMGVLSLLR